MKTASFARLAAFLSFAASSLIATASHAQQYSLTELAAPASSRYTFGSGLNDAGSVVGVFAPAGSDDVQVATVWNAGVPRSLTMTGMLSGAAVAINNAGQIVGSTFMLLPDGRFAERAASWTGTILTSLPTLGGTFSRAYGINEQGQVVGSSLDSDDLMWHAVVWNGTSITDIGVGEAVAINDSGQVVGVSDLGATLWNGTVATGLGTWFPTAINDAGSVVGYRTELLGEGGWRLQAQLWSNGTVVTLAGAPDRPESFAGDINNSGQAVGRSWGPDDAAVATLWNGTTAVDLNTALTGAAALYVTLIEATAINDLGYIVASGIDSRTGQYGAYLLAPVPLPAAFWLLLSALAPLHLLRRKRP